MITGRSIRIEQVGEGRGSSEARWGMGQPKTTPHLPADPPLLPPAAFMTCQELMQHGASQMGLERVFYSQSITEANATVENAPQA
jgi:hypothetical protein